jgi:SH3-like domain-containing protein
VRRLAAAAVLALAAGAACGAQYCSLGDQPAILYDAPSTKADKLFAVTRHYPFEVLVKLEQWTKVRDANGEVGWVENAALGDRSMVVVTAPLADVRAAPDPQSPLVFEAYKQVLLEVLEPPADGWVKVRHRDGQEGYIRTAHVWGA